MDPLMMSEMGKLHLQELLAQAERENRRRPHPQPGVLQRLLTAVQRRFSDHEQQGSVRIGRTAACESC